MTATIEENTTVKTTEGVVVMTKANCMPCKMTMKKLDKAGIAYTTVSLDENEEAVELIKSMGYMSAPVVIASETNHWSGLRPDRIDELKASLSA